MNLSIKQLTRSLMLAQSEGSVRKGLEYLEWDSLQGSLGRSLMHIDKPEASRINHNAHDLIDQSFGGSAVKWVEFMRKLAGTNAGLLDFNALAESGAMRKLAELETAHPKLFEATLKGSYADANALNKELDRPAKPPARKSAVTVVTIPSAEAGTPNDLTCAVSKRGPMSCDWDKAKTPAPEETVSQAGAHLLEAAANWLTAHSPKPKP